MRFDALVPDDGYQWWYVDALSEDGEHGLTVIIFLGSVFSPYYAAARRRGPTSPLDHTAFNVVLYEKGRKHWAFTERGQTPVERDADALSIGPSSVSWDGSALTIEVNEWTLPWPSRIRGKIRLYPEAVFDRAYPLDREGIHDWRPIAPCAEVEVSLSEPNLSWRGRAYFDSNRGSDPLESTLRGWTWSRAELRGGRTSVFYDVEPRAGRAIPGISLCFTPDGDVKTVEAPPHRALPSTGWRVSRETRSDPKAAAPRVVRTLEDTPFYSRSELRAVLEGIEAPVMHESLSLDRFKSLWVQTLLPFRAPRRA